MRRVRCVEAGAAAQRRLRRHSKGAHATAQRCPPARPSTAYFFLPMAPSLPFLAPPAPPLAPLPLGSGSLRLPIVLLTTLAGPKKASSRP